MPFFACIKVQFPSFAIQGHRLGIFVVSDILRKVRMRKYDTQQYSRNYYLGRIVISMGPILGEGSIYSKSSVSSNNLFQHLDLLSVCLAHSPR